MAAKGDADTMTSWQPSLQVMIGIDVAAAAGSLLRATNKFTFWALLYFKTAPKQKTHAIHQCHGLSETAEKAQH